MTAELEFEFELVHNTYKRVAAGAASRVKNLLLNCVPCSCWCFRTFEVKAGHVTKYEDGDGGYFFAKEGVHRMFNPFATVGTPRGSTAL